MSRGKNMGFYGVMTLLVVILFLLNLLAGTVDIPAGDVLDILMGREGMKSSWRFIVVESRLPGAVTAVLCGAALSTSGLLLQTAFRNPLAGPDVFGISSGAALGVAIVMLLLGGSLSTALFSVSGFVAILVGAFVGAMAVTALVFVCSSIVRDNVMLLVLGIMTGYLATSAISLLNFLATEEGVRSYMLWGMGGFGHVSLSHLPAFSLLVVVGLLCAVLLAKPLNALLLGERYASNLGVNVRLTRNLLLLVTGILTAAATAFCGPVAFLGLAVPHVARLLLTTANHRHLLPATMLCGAAVALLCNLLCLLPSSATVLPINAVTPLVGAPVIIYIILRRR